MTTSNQTTRPTADITITPTRETITIGLGDTIYTVRQPKSIVSSPAMKRILTSAATLHTALKGETTDDTDLSTINDDMTAIWEYLRLCLTDPDDYVRIRARVYGTPLNAGDLESTRFLTVDDLAEVSTDLLSDEHIADVVIQLIMRWNPQLRRAAETSQQPARPQDHKPPKKAKGAGTPAVRKKTAVTRGAAT